MTRIPFDTMHQTIKQAFVNAGVPENKADLCARIHTESSCDGVPSHGLNRVPRFVDYVHKGWVNPLVDPVLAKAMGAIEQYDGQGGAGITNALFCTERGIELAKQHGMGLIALYNTTHWMRGGAYGWHAAERGIAALCWTNTEPAMPVWGAKAPRVGNNPFVMAIPRTSGALVLDMAMSLYSYGKLEVTRLKGETLPYPGGYDIDGNLTSEPAKIEQSMRILPTGYWKGSSLAILLDAMAVLLSGGKAGSEMNAQLAGSCTGCCQIFMFFDPAHFSGKDFAQDMADKMVAYINGAEPAEGVSRVRYPGERVVAVRAENRVQGIPVDDGVWNTVVELAHK